MQILISKFLKLWRVGEIQLIYFFPSGHGNESYNLIGPDFPISDHGHSNAYVSFFPWVFFSFESLEKNK